MLLKKLAALLLAVTVTATAFGGCGKSDDKAQGGETQANVTDSSMEGNMYKKGLPLVKDKETLHMYSIKDVRQLDFNEMEFFKRLEEKTNIHIEWEFEDNTAGGQKKQLILASGQYPDAFFMGLNYSDLSKYYNDGIFIKLDSLIDQYGDNINAAFAQKPIYKQLCTYVDGSIYTLGATGEDEGHYNPDQLFIYKPWLDKLGLPIPSTMDEFYTTLKAFKEKDPNGNGKADELPFSFRNESQIQGIHSFFAAFGFSDLVTSIKTPDAKDHFVVENGKVLFTADKPEYKEAVTFINKLFQEGLFDKEGFTQDTKQYFAKGKTEQVTLGSFMLWNAVNMAGPERSKDYVPVPPMKGPGGKQLWTKYMGTSGNLNGAQFAITKACKNPEIVLRWINEFYDKKTSAEAIYGPIGLMFKEGADGMLEFLPTPDGMSWDEFRYKNCPVWPASAIFVEDYGKALPLPQQMFDKNKIKHDIYDPYLKSETLPPIIFDAAETEWNLSAGNDIQNYVNQMRSKWLLDGGIDKEWDAYLAKLKQLKIDEHVNKMQAAYDRFVK